MDHMKPGTGRVQWSLGPGWIWTQGQDGPYETRDRSGPVEPRPGLLGLRARDRTGGAKGGSFKEEVAGRREAPEGRGSSCQLWLVWQLSDEGSVTSGSLDWPGRHGLRCTATSLSVEATLYLGEVYFDSVEGLILSRGLLDWWLG